MKTISSHNVRAQTFAFDIDNGMSIRTMQIRHNGIYTQKRVKPQKRKKGKRERLAAQESRTLATARQSNRIKHKQAVYFKPY